MLDLEDRLTRHYTDVATAHSLHRAPSMAPRFAFAGLIVALIAGAAYLSFAGTSGDELIAGPGPGDAENNTIDPELLRLLERAPLEDQIAFTYLDITVARQGEVEEMDVDGTTLSSPSALNWAPNLPSEIITAIRFPAEHEATFGYRFEDIDRAVNLSPFNGRSTSFLVLDSDSSAVLDRAAAPAWAGQDIRSQEGSFDIRDWGDETSMSDSSNVRPLGETGQLTAFDGNVLLHTLNRDRLEPILAVDDGAPTLAEQPQLMAGLELLDFRDSLGLTALIDTDGSVMFEGEAVIAVPTLRIVETSLDGSSRVVFGFLPGTDTDAAEAGLRNAIGSAVEFATNLPTMNVVSVRQTGGLIVIDFEPQEGDELGLINGELVRFTINLFVEHQEILS